MKKLVCLLIFFAVMLNLTGRYTVNAEDNAISVLSEDFENDTLSYSEGAASSGEAYICKNPFGSNMLYGKSLCWDLTLNNELKTYFYNIDAEDAFLRPSDGNSIYTVVSFDIATIGTDKRPLYVSLMNKKANKNHFRIIFQNGSVYLNSTAVENKVSGITYADSEMINVQVVEQFSDDIGNKTEKVKAVYINGENIIASDMDFLDSGYGDNFSRIQLMCAKKNAGDENLALGCYIDNLSIRKQYGYNAGQCEKRYALLKLLQTACEEKTDSSLIESAFSVYADTAASEKELVATAKYLKNIFYSQKIKLKSFELSENKISDVVFTKDSEDARNFNTYIAVYNEDNILEGSEALEASEDTENSTVKFSSDKLEIPSNFKAMKLFMWGNSFNPLIEPISLSYKTLDDWKVYVNGELIYPDTSMCVDIQSNEIMIPLKNFLNNMGIELENNGNAYLANSHNGKSLILYKNSDNAIINGMSATLSVSTYLKDDVMLMAPMAVLNEAFGAGVELDEANKEAKVSYSVKEAYEALPSGIKLECRTGYAYVDYKVSGISSGSSIEVYYKLKQRNSERVESLVFQRAVTPKSVNGVYVGAIAGLRHNHQYDILIKISGDYGTKCYLKEYAFQTKNYSDMEYEDMVTVGNGELKLVPTYENMGYYLTAEAASCVIKYKKSSSDTWSEAYTPYKDPYESGSFRGSIVGLEDNCIYDVKAELYDENGNCTGEIKQSCNTWNPSPTIAETIRLSEIYSDGSLLLTNLKGSEDGWIKVINDTGISIAGDSGCDEAVLVSDCQYLILEGFKITGAVRHGINVTGSVANIIIKDADISGFGRAGIYDEENNQYLMDGTYVDHDSGIYVCDTEKLTIENCYIHDSNAYTNDWGKDIQTHPFGGVGICVRLKSQGVIRNNRIIGNDVHRWNDAIEGLGNGDRSGGVCRDTDIYNNVFSGCNDDSVELDGGSMNIRFYNNQVYDTFSGISLAPVYVGPAYIFNNLIIAEYGVKSGGEKDNRLGISYLFNNTIICENHNLRNTGINGSSEYHAVTRNNIFFSANGASIYNANVDSRDSCRNDMLWGKMLKLNSEDKQYEIFAIPDFSTDYSLTERSAGNGAAKRITNFNECDDKNIGCDITLLKK